MASAAASILGPMILDELFGPGEPIKIGGSGKYTKLRGSGYRTKKGIVFGKGRKGPRRHHVKASKVKRHKRHRRRK